MKHNRMLRISMGNSRKATHWPQTELSWQAFTERLKTPVYGTETLNEYLALPKSRQDDLKDVGGFVGGTFAGDRRKAANVEGRDLVTLDLDNIPTAGTEDILRRVEGLGCAALVYSTRKHSDYKPRLRVILPLDRTVQADEYEPIARKLASLIGIDFCDPTTFEASRLMYWASCCKDSPYIYRVYDAGFCSADGILSMYGDWRNVAEWPQVSGADAITRRRLAKQENPQEKPGVIGAFCRTYTIPEVMDKYLPGMYDATDQEDRYTYTGGSTTGGAVLYDQGLFLYSHHATDPCSGQLVNAFDLVRLHKFGDRDDSAKEGTPNNKLPSFLAMEKLALEDPVVAARMAKERKERAQEIFPVSAEEPSEENENWMKKLEVDGHGAYRKTINNAVIVLENDPLLKGKIVTDEFASCGMLLGATPWNQSEEKRRWRDEDDAGFYRYMETYYGITGRDKLDSALLLVSAQNKINDVREYLKGLKWDGKRRVDTLLTDYLGAEDSPYTRAVMRKSLCAAVGRAIVGGIKYDYMPILTGPQGIGKSTFLRLLGKDWFSDSLTTFEGKDAAELIQGTWINEIGELTAMNRQETNAVKQFLSKSEDIYRAAYGRRTEKYPRRCVFFGTSNDTEFLKDTTGNRRFWPVDVGEYEADKSVWAELPGEVDQIWAEAYVYWQLGEPLYLSPEVEAIAKQKQEDHREVSGKEGMILEFLEQKIPLNWDQMDLPKRRTFLQGHMQGVDESILVPRDKTCALEIWAECFHGDPRYMKRMDSLELNAILASLPGWERNKSKRRYGPYGIQKGYERKK